MMNNLTVDEVLQRYPPCLRGNIKELWNEEISICPSAVSVDLPPNKLEPDYEEKYGNSLFVEVPYAGKFVQWEIIFNDENPTFAPDFDVINDPFLSDPDVDVIEKYLPTLTSWDVNNPKMLVMFVHELITLYKKYQIEKLHSDSKYVLLQEEYRQLKEELNLDDDDFEIFIDNNVQYFLIPIKLDYSNLPVCIKQTYFDNGVLMDPGIDWAALKISFLSHKCNVALQLSPRLEGVFGNASTLHIPPYKSSGDMIEYVRSIKDLLGDRIKQIQELFEVKRKYVGALLSQFGTHVTEYDNIEFGKATFLFQVESFYFLTEITLGKGFPVEQPVVTLRSIYHKEGSGEPASMMLKNYPYNSKWTAEDMIQKLIVHISSDVNRFKTFCINSQS